MFSVPLMQWRMNECGGKKTLFFIYIAPRRKKKKERKKDPKNIYRLWYGIRYHVKWSFVFIFSFNARLYKNKSSHCDAVVKQNNNKKREWCDGSELFIRK